jgi:hypothetical protein
MVCVFLFVQSTLLGTNYMKLLAENFCTTIVLMKIIGRPLVDLVTFIPIIPHYVSSNLVETKFWKKSSLDTFFRHNYFWSVYLLYQLF